ncbi:SapB/AmfS family lanthipeptide [Streptomyces carminius]|nr:SapB/AmfS family lanthipeptide [Streptomyces carminius]
MREELCLYDLQVLESADEPGDRAPAAGDSSHSILCEPHSALSLIICG